MQTQQNFRESSLQTLAEEIDPVLRIGPVKHVKQSRASIVISQ